MKRGLFIVPAHLDALARKGVMGMLKEREAGGYLDVITLHPHAPKTRTVILSDHHTVYEIGADVWLEAPRFVRRVVNRVLYPFRLIRTFLHIGKTHRPQFIRGQDPYWIGFIALLGGKLLALPVSISIHSDYDQRYLLDGAKGAPVIFGSRRLAKRLETFVLTRADLVLPIRKSLGEKAIETGATRERVRVIPHGLDLGEAGTDIDIRTELGILPSDHILSFAGRLSNENYIDDILGIARRLGRLRSDFRVVVAGGGNEDSRVRNEIARDPELSKVMLVGFRSRDFVMQLRSESAVSLCLMGGFSLVEAMAAGSPVIAYDIEWHYELVRDGETGYLIEEGDISTAVSRIDQLLANKEARARMGHTGKDLARERHSICKTRKVKVAVYEELIGRRNDLTQRANEESLP